MRGRQPLLWLYWALVVGLVGSLMTATTTNAAPPAISFAVGITTTSGVGTGPNGVAVADFDGNGKLDLAVANGASNNVSILLGYGTGTFIANNFSPFAAGTLPTAIVGADFDGDTKADLAIVDNTANAVTVLINNGSGTFTAAANSPFTVGSLPIAIAVGDFNNDNHKDLAVVNNGGSSVTILLGDGSGDFAPASGSPITVGSGARSIAVGKFNNDSNQDLVVANSTANTLSILTGDGLGGFSASTITGFTNPYAVAVGDFNKDTKQDIAVVSNSNHNVTILLGDGLGAFQTKGPYTANMGASALAIADFNGDGILDIATADGLSTVSLLAGNGDGTFAAVVVFNTGNSPRGIVAADFNGDGKPDLVTPNSTDNSVRVLPNISAYPATTLVVTAPGSVVPGVPFSLTVTARDTNNAVATGYQGTIQFTGGGLGASLPGNYTFTSADGGIHTFTGLALTTLGNQTVIATDTTNSAVTGSTATYVVPQAASQITLTAPANAQAGTSFSLTATMKDAGGHVVTNYSGSVQFASTDMLGVLPGLYTFTAADNGTHTFTATLKSAGSRTVTVSTLGTPSLTGNATIAVSGPNITSVSPASGPETGGTSVAIMGSGFSTPLTVTFGGVAATNISLDPSGTSLTCNTPLNQTPATVDIVVTTGSGAAFYHGFTYLPPSLPPAPVVRPGVASAGDPAAVPLGRP